MEMKTGEKMRPPRWGWYVRDKENPQVWHRMPSQLVWIYRQAWSLTSTLIGSVLCLALPKPWGYVGLAISMAGALFSTYATLKLKPELELEHLERKLSSTRTYDK